MNNETSPIATIIAFVVIVIAIIVGSWVLLSTRPATVEITINPPIPTATAAPTATREPITVYITGAVANPQTTLTVPYNSRVQDAIDAAGGLTDDANLDLVNLAGIVRDGDQIHVPMISETTETSTNALPTPSGGGIIFINSATQAELETLPNVGPALAQRIMEYRDANGGIANLADLDNVSGIGESTLAELEPLISFE